MKTEEAYEEYLNEVIYEKYSSEKLLHEFGYLTSPNRENYITEDELLTTSDMGTLIRKLDPIRFQVGFNEWNP